MDKYIYSLDDIESAIFDAVEDTFNWNYDLTDWFSKKIKDKISRYANWYRFQDRNCPGCVNSPKECDVAYGRGEYKDVWEKAYKGVLFDCPARGNGTMMVKNGKVEGVDLSSRDEVPYPTIKLPD